MLVALSAGLGIAVSKTDGGTRVFLAGCLAVNLIVAVLMIVNHFPYAYRLMPHELADQIESPD